MNLCRRTWQQLANSRKVFFSQKVCSLLSNLPSPSTLPTVLKEQIQLSVQNIVLRIHTLLNPFETGLLFMLLTRARCCKFCKFKSYPLFLSLPATENIELVIQLHFSGILICNFYLKHALGGSTVENCFCQQPQSPNGPGGGGVITGFLLGFATGLLWQIRRGTFIPGLGPGSYRMKSHLHCCSAILSLRVFL